MGRKEQLTNNEQQLSRRSFIRGAVVGAGGALLVAGAGTYLYATSQIKGEGGPFQELSWRGTRYDTRSTKWAEFAHDPNAGEDSWPSDWHTVGILATDRRGDLDVRQAQLNGWQAVAYRTDEQEIQVGTMEHGANFFARNPHNERQYAVGMRVGPGDLEAVQGLWLPERDEFIAAEVGTAALRAMTTTGTIQQDYPGVRYI